jgi:ABC-type Fe3+/spermidine/putrescine transport system ATPase subunit
MLTLQNLMVSYETQPVLRGVDLQVESGEILCLLGPSGSGKSTLLRAVAGLEVVDKGDVAWDGQSVLSLPVHTRDFGLMFQDFALFPHLNVADNVAFGLKMRGVRDPAAVVCHMLDLVGLKGFERRNVSQLSGGEKQRVALARSLAPHPRLLMLDEPLGSLDAVLRSRLVVELRQIIKRIGVTAIYVTHDQQEAFAIADRIAILNAGMIEQVGEPEVIYWQPATTFCAEFLGLANILPVQRYENGRALTALGTFALEQAADTVLIHPLGVSVASQHEAGFSAVIEERTFQGDHYRLRVRHDSGAALTVLLPASDSLVPEAGARAEWVIAPNRVLPLRQSG